MRITDDDTRPTVLFIIDLGTTACLVETPSGFRCSTDIMGDNDTPFYDPFTKEEVFYGSWYSW